MRTGATIVIGTLLILNACAGVRQYEVAVSGLKDATARRGESYVMLPGMEGVDTADLQYLEVKRYLKRALAKTGMTEASRSLRADVVIFVSYGIGEPKDHAYSYTMPVFGQVGGGTSTYSGTTYGPGGSVTSTGTVTSQPRTGIVGHRSVAGTYTTFTRHLALVAVDVATYQRSHTIRQVWKTAVVSVGSSGDLRLILPAMVAAAEPYIGTDTGTALFVRLREDDDRIRAVRGDTTFSEP